MMQCENILDNLVFKKKWMKNYLKKSLIQFGKTKVFMKDELRTLLDKNKDKSKK